MLKKIPSVLSPDLVKILMEMGHGDELVIADGNFPASSHAKRLIRCDSAQTTELLAAILDLFPLDYAVDCPVYLMAVPAGNTYKAEICDEYKQIIENYEKENNRIEFLKKSEFYDKARNAYVIIATGEKRRFANILLRKGII
jgi:L-fucose mutarotase